MESPPESCFSNCSTLRWTDYLALSALCAVLFGFSLVQPRVFTTHETTHCLNVREMFQSDEYLIPTYGGRPWLERPPVPHWLTGIGAALFGDMNREWSMRLGSIFTATLAVLIFAWAVGGCFGRSIGLMSGAILATMREFAAYAVGPEADIFLASAVTICGALLLKLQFAQCARDPSLTLGLSRPFLATFFGKRSWMMLVFFALLGLTNWMKGPLFGMLFVLLPMAAYFAWSRDFVRLQHISWFWGWLVLAAVGATWPILAYLRYPDVVDLWAVDYGVRWQSGYIGEPFWYYLVHQPWNLFPWTIPAVVGLAVTASAAFKSGSNRTDVAPLRFIWCWAIVPVVFFSFFKGKHHHYLLSCLAPAAVLGAFGSFALWQWIRDWPSHFRKPGLALALVGIPGAILIGFFGKKIPGPDWIRWSTIVGWPVITSFMWWVATRREGRIAFAGTCVLIVALNVLAYTHRSHFMDSYTADRAFIVDVQDRTLDAKPLFVINDEHPLNSSWLVYYLGERARLLHNRSFLRDNRIDEPIVYLVCRQRDEKALEIYGETRLLTQSAKARGESSPADRWTLYELRFHPHLARISGDVRISPLQATGRKPGPFLGNELATSR